MANDRLILISSDRATSDEGLTAWLILRLSGLAFEHRVELEKAGRGVSLEVEGERIDHSLAIAMFVAELVPPIWPQSPRSRAQAYSLAVEAFGARTHFRNFLPLSLGEQFMPSAKLLRRVENERNLIVERWQEARASSAHDQPFLFGDFGAVDAFHAPLAARFVTYGLETVDGSEAYVDAVLSYPLVAEWQAMAAEGDNSPKAYNGTSAAQMAAAASDHPPNVGSKPVAVSTQTAIDEDLDKTIVEPTITEQPALEPQPADRKSGPEPDPKGERTPVEVAESDPPFRVDLPSENSAKERFAVDVEPVEITVRPGNRLFRNSGKRLFQPNYRRPVPEAGEPASEPATEETLDGTPSRRPSLRPAGIKPIGGEIRRRR